MGSEVSFAGQDLSIRRGGVGNCNAGNADRVHEQKDNPVPKALAELRGNDDTNGISDEWYGLEVGQLTGGEGVRTDFPVARLCSPNISMNCEK